LTERNETQTGGLGGRLTEGNHLLDPDDQVSLRELALVPWKRKYLVAGVTVACILAAIFLSVAMKPKYRATATIELNEQSSSGASMLSGIAAMASGEPDDLKVKIETETAVIKDDSIALAVLGKLGMLRLENPDTFSKAPGPLASADELPAERREALVGNFEGHLKVAEVGSSRLISITFSDHNPQVAAQVANQVVAEYKSYLLSSNFTSSREVSQWLSAQLGDLSSQVTKTQQAVAEFERTHNLSSSMLGLATLGGSSGATSTGGSSGGGGGAVVIPELDRLAALNGEITQAEATRLGREAIYRMTETQNPDLISSLGSGSLASASGSSVTSQGGGLEVLNTLREQESTARIAYASAETKYGAKNPHLTDIANQIKSIEDQMQLEMGKIRQRAKNDLTLAEQDEKALRTAFEAQKGITSKMNDDVVQ